MRDFDGPDDQFVHPNACQSSDDYEMFEWQRTLKEFSQLIRVKDLGSQEGREDQIIAEVSKH